MKYCEILIQDPFLFNKTLTYSCANFDVQIGTRVFVLVRGRKLVGFVLDVYEAKPEDFAFKVLSILELIDEEPIINDELFELANTISYQTVSPLITVLQAMLPNSLKPRKTFKNPRQVMVLSFNKLDDKKLTPKQEAFVNQFKDQKYVLLKDAREVYTSYETLVKRHIFKKYEIEKEYIETRISDEYPELKLTSAQAKVYDGVDLSSNDIYLLHGVTGSGKTEVYLQLANEVIKQGRSVLFLVPEISLTPQMINRVSKRFNEDVAIYHSQLNNQEKYEQYLRVKNDEVKIVVGTRSASFMPFKDLGLIIMDEEHDTSYKQNNTPRYHALDVIKARAKYHHAPVILGSASPSLETYARALRGVYKLLELPNRINDSFPQVSIIDTKQALYNKESSFMTEDLKQAIQDRLNKQEQVILLLNRRGYMTFLKDKHTDQVLMCPHCDISLNYHKVGNVLKCHQCDYTTNQIPLGSDNQKLEIVGSGVGTQRLCEYLETEFKDARIIRMDRDTTVRKGAHKKILEDFEKGKYDILVGTQMIAKGLDIENVTLVGILNIDQTLAYEDFRSVEYTFNLILQASGRSGRGGKNGEVMIQTFNKDHYAIQYGVYNQYKRFFNQEMKYRKLANYPPYSYLVSIVFSDLNEIKAFENAQSFLKIFKRDDIHLIGPSSIYKLSDMHRVRIILKSKDLDKLLKEVNNSVKLYYSLQKGGISVDVNPLTLV